MIIMRSKAFKSGSLQGKTPAYSSHTRQDVRADLLSRGLIPSLHTTVWRLRGLEADQYKAFLKVMGKIGYPKNSDKQGFPLTLILPPLEDLRGVDFTEIFESGEAIKSIKDRCIRPRGKLYLNLTLLPWIYAESIIRKPQPENI